MFKQNLLKLMLNISSARLKRLNYYTMSPHFNLIYCNCWDVTQSDQLSLTLWLPKKQTTKFSSGNLKKMLSSSYIILRIQKLEDKQCRSRMRWLIMSHLMKIYAVCKSSFFLSLVLQELKRSTWKCEFLVLHASLQGSLEQTKIIGWIDDLRFYVLFNSNSVISGRCLDDNERLCAMETRLWLRRFQLEWGSNSIR